MPPTIGAATGRGHRQRMPLAAPFLFGIAATVPWILFDPEGRGRVLAPQRAA